MLKEAGAITRPRVAPVLTRTNRTAVAAHALRIARRTALGVLGDHATADDVAQEVAITVLRRIDDLRDPAALDAWVHRIAVRRAIKEARRSTTRRAAEIAGHELHERTAPVDDPTAGDELDGALAVLEGLPARQRAALTLRYVHDLDDAAIATALVLAATAALAIGVVGLPSGSSGPAGPADLLNATAAAAADVRPAPVTDFRWTSARETWVYRDRARDGRTTAETSFTQSVERWIDRDRQGLVRRGAVTDLRRTGDPALLRLQPRDAGPAGDRPYEAGDTNVSPADVPTDADAARGYLDRRLAAQYGGRALPPEQVRWERTRTVVDLLGTAALRPRQRAALWGVLAGTEGARGPADVRTASGRRGTMVQFEFAGGTSRVGDGPAVTLPEGVLGIVFDPDTAEVLESSFSHDGKDADGGTPERFTFYDRSGWSPTAGQRPAGR